MNRYRISATSFLAYFVMSGMLAPIGIISGSLAQDFGLAITEATESFSWLTVGIFVGAVIALFVFSWLKIKTIFLAVYLLLFASLAWLPWANSLAAVQWPLAIVGVCCGVGLPAAALVIARTYDQTQRASMLVITDGFFSVAGIVCAWLAVTLLALQGAWWSAYAFVALVALVIILLASMSRYPESEQQLHDEPTVRTWPLSAWLCIAALCAYTIGQNAILWWLPQHAQQNLGVDSDFAGALVGQFWSGMFAAQVFVSWWVYKIGVNRLLPLAALGTAVFSVPIWWLLQSDWLFVFAALFGFANLGLLKVVLSYASHFTPVASSKLVSALLLGGTTGTAVSPWLSSHVVALSDVQGALQFGTVSYIAMVGLLLLAMRVNPGPQYLAAANS